MPDEPASLEQLAELARLNDILVRVEGLRAMAAAASGRAALVLDSVRRLPTARSSRSEPRPATPTRDDPPSPFTDLKEACKLSGLKARTLRNLLHARDPQLLAARLPGKAYRFHRERFMTWVESRPDYARLPGVKKARRKS